MIPKFRGWDRLTDTVQDVLDINFLEKTATVSQNDILWYKHDNNRDLSDVVLMQSTGLKDKNGVEIFDGDIVIGSQNLITGVLTPAEVKGIVKYSSDNTMFYLEEKNSGHDKFMHSLGSSIYIYEVVGNIHENPELLEVEE
ncbi:YopX family protein [Enterococcus sp. AZ072]|uniref:YopX family protein n=1 Tax=unclassified Enterococcus TaxID=2608891 RepID=UPI003D290280